MEFIISIVLLVIIVGAIKIATKNSHNNESELKSTEVDLAMERLTSEPTPSTAVSKPTRKPRKVSTAVAKEAPASKTTRKKSVKQVPAPAPATTSAKKATKKAQPKAEPKVAKRGRTKKGK